MKALRLIFVIACLSLYALVAFAVQPSDFYGHQPVDRGGCSWEGTQRACVIFTHENKMYLLVSYHEIPQVEFIYEILTPQKVLDGEILSPPDLKEVYDGKRQI